MTYKELAKEYAKNTESGVNMTDEEFEKETINFYKEIERKKARVLRNLDVYLYGGKR